LCRSYQTAKQADSIVEKDGLCVMGAKGGLIKHPATLISAEAWGKVRMYSNDLGLNHLSRQRMSASEAETQDTKEARYLG
jgi:P27 family predicted phage terminase small subunit